MTEVKKKQRRKGATPSSFGSRERREQPDCCWRLYNFITGEAAGCRESALIMQTFPFVSSAMSNSSPEPRIPVLIVAWTASTQLAS